jgi:anaerobic magnesium-protoporphyrin IX monomethyl ester cyclase
MTAGDVRNGLSRYPEVTAISPDSPTGHRTARRLHRVVLLFPNPISMVPNGFMYVAKRFRANGFDTAVQVNSFADFKTMDDYYAYVRGQQPDAVGLSYATLNVLEIYALQKRLRAAGYLVMAGGDHPTICPEEVLRNGADLVVRGEGELAIDDICAWIKAGGRPDDRHGLRSTSFVLDGRVVHNASADRLRNLDPLGDLDVAGLELSPFRTVDGSIKGLNVILGGRGCPFRCTFCSHNAWTRYGCRSVDAMIAEMVARHEQYGIDTFYISDETFSVQRVRVAEFCRRLIKEHLGLKWLAQTRVNCVDDELIDLFKRSGCQLISLGVESADDYTLEKVRKGHTAAEAYRTVEQVGKTGIPLFVNLMTGFPWQTTDAVKKDIAFVRTMGRYVDCFQLFGAVIPYPDTPLYEEYREEYGFTEFWLRPKYQYAGTVIYQNVPNPYLVSTYWQRNLYDDTYVKEDYFFRFSDAYKRWVACMGALIGWHAVKAASRRPIRSCVRFGLGIGSRLLYELSPTLEQRVVGSLVRRNRLHQKRDLGRFIRT